MKKKCKRKSFPSGGISKILLRMKLLTFFILVSMVTATASSYSQQTKFSLKLSGATVKEVFHDIESNSGFILLYNEKQLDVNRKVDVDVNDKTVESILRQVFEGTNNTYKIYDRQIVILADELKDSSSPLKVETSAEQNRQVTGTVKDSKGVPLPGVTILAKGTTSGTTTDNNGTFTFTVPANVKSLIFSFVGMKTVETLYTGAANLNIVLQEEILGLDEVVAIGYGTQKKSDLTGAVAKVASKDLTLGGTISNAAQALQGRTAGVLVVQNSSAPGGSISVRIRGSNSISSNNEPLYVVDGFPSTSGKDINPNDIESMEILKDASATAIYGARGANGVILITTKRGKSGENSIIYSGHTGVQNVVNPFKMLNGKQYMQLANSLFQEIDGQQNQQYAVYTQSQLQSNVNTNWVDETSRIGNVQDHNIQFKGGSEKTQVLTSLGYYNQEGVLKNTSYSRFSGRINVDQKVNDYIKAGAAVSGQRGKSNYQLYAGNILNENILLSILTYDPTVLPRNPNGTFGRPPGGRGDNPLANLLERTNDLVSDKLNGNAYLEIRPMEGLLVKATGGVEMIHNFQGTYLPRSTYQGGIDNGDASTTNSASTKQLFDTYIQYSKKIADVHSLSVMAGYSYEKTVAGYQIMAAKGFSTDAFLYNNMGAASTLTNKASFRGENILISYFGRANYSLKDKYLLTITMRQDGSSRFGANTRWGSFPSGALAWRMIEEPFIKNLGLFSNLKYRLGYGKTGNDQIGDYARFALMSNTNLTYDGVNNTSGTQMSAGTPENPGLKWETTSQYNTGLDMGFLKGRLTATVDFYYKKTTDLLINKALPLYSGFTSGQSNVGSIQNKGFEVELLSNNLTGNLKWETRLNFAVNRNKVLDLGGGGDIRIGSSKPMGNVSEEDFAVIRVGQPLGSLYGYVYDGVLKQGETYAPQPVSVAGDPKFKDISGPNGVPDGKITSADRTILASATPRFIYGLTNTFSFKNFDLSIFIYGSQGNHLLNMTRMNLEWAHTTDALNRWTPTNQNTDIPRNGFYYSKYGGYINSHFIEDASFLRLKNLTFGYTLPQKIKFLKSCRFYVVAENLFTITGYTGWNPEVDTKGYETGGSGQTANAGAGLDFNSYPSLKSYSIGVNVTF